MKPNPIFAAKPKAFWAFVRTLSQHLGYTERGEGRIRVHTPEAMVRGLEELGLDATAIVEFGVVTALGRDLVSYFAFRADLLDNSAQQHLMDAAEAKAEFNRLKKQLRPKCPLPMNKQKGKMRATAFLTGMVNMLIEASAKDGLKNSSA